jgi:hypothetical protein
MVMTGDASLRVYDFHGLRLGCRAEPSVTDALASRLGRFAYGASGPCDIRFDYASGDEAGQDALPKPTADARPIYESDMGQVLYSESADRLFISSVWPIQAVCDPRAGETTISIQGDVAPHLWALSHPLLTIPLIEKLKRRAHFSLHAAAVARGGKGLVIPGSSGAGKSTLALALARAGFDFMGDDMLFLVRTGAGLRALALPEAFDLTEQTVKLFPDLRDLLEEDRRVGWPKYQLHVDERFGAKIAWHCEPKVLVFPRIAASGRSSLSTMDRNEALFELLPNILLTESNSSQRHLDTLTELVAPSACYRLETGTDFGELAGRLEQLLEATA